MLPSSRDTTYVSGTTPVKGNDLNDLQDQIVAINKLVTGQAQANWANVVLAVAAAFNAAVTFAAGAVAAVNQHFTVSGTGRFKHGTMTLAIPASAFQFTGSAIPTGYLVDGTSVRANTANFVAPIGLAAGKRITAIRAFVKDSATGPTTLHFDFVGGTAGSGALIGSSPTTTGAGTLQTIQLTGLTTVIAAGNNYAVQVSTVAGSAVGIIYGAEVDYDHP